MTSDLQSTPVPKHCHGIDCCWDCFEGRPAHPRDDEDYDCARELAEFGEAAEHQGCRVVGADGS